MAPPLLYKTPAYKIYVAISYPIGYSQGSWLILPLCELVIYQTVSGRCPFEDWLNDLSDIQARATIHKRLNRVRLGNFGDCKSVGKGVLELRVNLGPGYRVYLGREGLNVVVLLCGGNKTSQSKDIKKARLFWSDYLHQSKKKGIL